MGGGRSHGPQNTLESVSIDTPTTRGHDKPDHKQPAERGRTVVDGEGRLEPSRREQAGHQRRHPPQVEQGPAEPEEAEQAMLVRPALFERHARHELLGRQHVQPEELVPGEVDGVLVADGGADVDEQEGRVLCQPGNRGQHVQRLPNHHRRAEPLLLDV